jgi:hypothetical protein
LEKRTKSRTVNEDKFFLFLKQIFPASYFNLKSLQQTDLIFEEKWDGTSGSAAGILQQTNEICFQRLTKTAKG